MLTAEWVPSRRPGAERWSRCSPKVFPRERRAWTARWAINVLPPDLTRDQTVKQRFLQEAQAASALDHPNICTIYEINETDDGQLYLVMAP